MSTFNFKTKQLLLPAPAQGRPKNPIRTGAQLHTQTASQVISGSGSATSNASTVSRHAARDAQNALWKLSYSDRRDFISGSARSPMQAARLINAMRRQSKKQTKSGHKMFIKTLEQLLSELGFGTLPADQLSDNVIRPPFSLDGRCNLILLDPTWHTSLDLYGSLTFWPGLDVIMDLTVSLMSANSHWEEARRLDPSAPRKLSSKFSVSKYTWSVLILHPEDVLPEGEPMTILRPDRRSLDRLPNDNTRADAWTQCRLVQHKNFPIPALGYHDRNTDSWRELNIMHVRKDDVEELSLFAFIVNIHSKLKAHIERNETGHCYDSEFEPWRKALEIYSTANVFFAQTTLLMNAIFYFPSPDDIENLRTKWKESLKSPNDSPMQQSPSTPTASTSQHRDGDDATMEDVDTSKISALKDDEHNSSDEDDDQDSDSDSDSDSDDEQDFDPMESLMNNIAMLGSTAPDVRQRAIDGIITGGRGS
ncbi:hypothetical protein BKA62DRAFT_716231 [Auriculariales sp. MPI-PUGE-AT-0066]|nr:hypothetical protein BKA62DRAFT_716231 [Auriculariales sp. MPI-PUGE-AT-0066]